jgi:hypothetical protein
MEQNSIVYSDIAITSADGEISTNAHTHTIYFWNQDGSTDATIKLNGKHQVVIPAASNFYIEIKGDYTKFQVMTASVTLSVFAIG